MLTVRGITMAIFSFIPDRPPAGRLSKVRPPTPSKTEKKHKNPATDRRASGFDDIIIHILERVRKAACLPGRDSSRC